jgi:DNA-binding winged helix-turn-helix (wHTH) protein
MTLRFASFTLDTDRRQVLREREPVHLSPKAFDLLWCLAERRPTAVAKHELYERIWPGTFVVDANLTVLVAELRRALGDDPQAPRIIRTVPRFGYAFCADAAAIVEPPAARVRVGLTLEHRVLPLAEGENLIGRDPSCGIWLDKPGVSRVHARIVVTGTLATIEDLDSTNGTFVGGVRVTSLRHLRDSDIVSMGPVELAFRIWAPGTTVETERISR